MRLEQRMAEPPEAPESIQQECSNAIDVLKLYDFGLYNISQVVQLAVRQNHF